MCLPRKFAFCVLSLKKIAFILSFCAFGSCFRMLAITLLSHFFGGTGLIFVEARLPHNSRLMIMPREGGEGVAGGEGYDREEG